MNKNTNYLVKNINGTSKNKLSNKSWIQLWREYTKSSRTTCCVIGCSKEIEVGAHVQIKDKRCSNEWYIAPFCKEHNNYNKTEEMFIDSRVTLIPANKQILKELGF